jgi:hypothetical protein
MASLRSMILGGHVPTSSSQRNSEYFDVTRKALESRDTILVDATSVGQDLYDDPLPDDLIGIPLPKPPYHIMWLEFLIPAEENKPTMRLGSLVASTEIVNATGLQSFLDGQSVMGLDEDAQKVIRAVQQTTIVQGISWFEAHGRILSAGIFTYWLNEEGDYQDSRYAVPPGSAPRSGLLAAAWALVVFSRMNHRNVKLVEMAARAGKPPKKGSRLRYSSPWNEIVVTSDEQIRREYKGEIEPTGEKREIRFHKVRGHSADYRKGKGLFGKLRVLIWVPEHTVGDPELGTVVSSYRVQGAQQ